MRKYSYLLAVAAVVAAASSASAAGWGNFKGKFVLEGKAPAPAKLKVDKDKAECEAGGKALEDESLVVGDKGGIADIVVSLYVKPVGGKKPEVHPDYAALLKEAVEMDNKGCKFTPRITVVRTGQELILKNTDPVGHNVNGALPKEAFNVSVPAGGQVSKTFKIGEQMPAIASCNIHTWMRGYLVVREDPYVAVTDKDGSFEIKNIPAGEWTFRVWHQRSGFVEDVKLDGKATKWKAGRFDLKIEDKKDVDFGEIKVGLAEFPAEK